MGRGKYLAGSNQFLCHPKASVPSSPLSNGLLSGGLLLCKHGQHLGLQCLIDYMRLLTGLTAPIHLTHNEYPPCLRLFSPTPFHGCLTCVYELITLQTFPAWAFNWLQAAECTYVYTCVQRHVYKTHMYR